MENNILIPKEIFEEYLELKEMQGRLYAAQEYVNDSEYVYVDDICLIMGIDITAYRSRSEEMMKDYHNSLNGEGGSND